MAARPPRPELLALLRAVKAEPENETPQLVLADWLQDQDDPADRALGEFLYVRRELDRRFPGDPDLPELTRRLYSLWSRHRRDWFAPFFELGWHVTPDDFRWGLFYPEAPTIGRDGRGLPPPDEALEWVGGIRYTWRGIADVVALLDSPFAGRLLGLSLLPGHLGAAPADIPIVLATTPTTSQPVELRLAGLEISAAGARNLARAPLVSRLTSLKLPGANLGSDGFRALSTSPALNRLRVLDVSRNRLSIPSARAISEGGAFPALTSLNLANNDLGADGTLILVAYPPAGRLRELNLRANRAADYGAEAIARQAHLDKLTRLDLSDNLLTDRGARALAGAEHLKTLEVLRLSRNGIGDDGARALAESPHLAGLRWLDLSHNPATGAKAAAALRERFGHRVTLGEGAG